MKNLKISVASVLCYFCFQSPLFSSVVVSGPDPEVFRRFNLSTGPVSMIFLNSPNLALEVGVTRNFTLGISGFVSSEKVGSSNLVYELEDKGMQGLVLRSQHLDVGPSFYLTHGRFEGLYVSPRIGYTAWNTDLGKDSQVLIGIRSGFTLMHHNTGLNVTAEVGVDYIDSNKTKVGVSLKSRTVFDAAVKLGYAF